MHQQALSRQLAVHTVQPAPGLVLRRKCGCGQHTMAGEQCSACSKTPDAAVLQRSAMNDETALTAPLEVHQALNSPGQPLDMETRSFFEPRFGHDFSHVRVHTGEKAAQSARAVGALAYTVGRDVVLGSNQHTAGTSEGRRLLAHELTHVVQQGGVRDVSGALAIGPADDSHEREAASAERTIASGAGIGSTHGLSRPRLQRSPYDVLRDRQESRDIKFTPTKRLIPFSKIDLAEPPAQSTTQPSPSSRPEGPEPLPQYHVPKLAPEDRKKEAEREGLEVEPLVEGSLSNREITTNLEVSIPVRKFGPNYTFGLPFLIGKEVKLTVATGPPKPPFGLSPAMSQLGVNLSVKALTLEFEPMMAIIRGLKELEVSVVGEADINPLNPFAPELAIKPEVSAEQKLGRLPISIYGRFGYKLSFPPGGGVEAAPTWGLGFKIFLPRFGGRPESRKR